MKSKFYLTTPLYYVNDVPHIGHAYTTIAADVLARYKRMMGYDVFFLTGTDEHGQKVLHAAEENKKDPKEYVDLMVEHYKAAWKFLEISFDDFIRTSEPRHEEVVQKIFKKLFETGDIYKGEYEGWYCIPCETFWTERELREDLEGRYLCPDCGRVTDKLKEETYFFKQSKWEKDLLNHIENNPDFIQPLSRRNEIISFIKTGLKDLSITRTAFPWGVQVPSDPRHVVYVWFDALINYVTAPGYILDEEKFNHYWPADVHLMGKEIVRFHAVTWPCMLLALGIPLPKKIFGHGWWTVEGEKMSKSKGNVVDPVTLAAEFGADSVRYFLMREVPFGMDGDFSKAALLHRYNADLANDLGNLLHRTLTMVEKYFEGVVPEPRNPSFDSLSKELIDLANKISRDIDGCIERLAFSDALITIWELINKANNYIEKEAPWKFFKEGKKDELASFVYNLIEVLRIVGIFVTPYMPSTGKRILEELGLSETLRKEPPTFGMKIAKTKVRKGEPLFPRREK